MGIDHFFDRPPARTETGGDRQALLDALHAEKRRSALLQAKVDELVGQVSKQQAERIQPVVGPQSVHRDHKDAGAYRAVFGDSNEQLTLKEIAQRVGRHPKRVKLWLRLYGYGAGIVVVGERKMATRGRRAKLYSRTDEKPRKALHGG